MGLDDLVDSESNSEDSGESEDTAEIDSEPEPEGTSDETEREGTGGESEDNSEETQEIEMSEPESDGTVSTDSSDIDASEIEKEEELMFGYGGENVKPVQLLSDYLPHQEDYAAKTVLTKEQVHLLAALEQLSTFFEEIDEYDEAITEWIKAYEKRLTSTHGLSRDEFVKILVSMNGGSVDSEDNSGLLRQVLEADMGDSDG